MSKVKVRSENYKDGLLNGEIKWYHGNGKKHYEVFYKEGKERIGKEFSIERNVYISRQLNLLSKIYHSK